MNNNKQLIVNSINQKIITTILENLDECDSFKIIVAFITKSGVSLLKTKLLELEKKRIKGKIITGDYLNFTMPNALKELMNFSNIELKMLLSSNLHMKGYIFYKEKNVKLMVGSSNLTQNALTTNMELNINLELETSNEIYIEMNNIFNKLWNEAIEVKYIIDEYVEQYNTQTTVKSNESGMLKIEPNIIQYKALEKLDEIRNNHSDKALVIAATGTGKTYLAGFDIKRLKPKRLLFIAHREYIITQALETFKTLINNKSFGIYSGVRKEVKKDYIFATIQSLSNNINDFKAKEFDYIIIDEVHHGGAKTYQKIIDYFKPNFLLGLTATPERADGFNIFKMFDYNIASEIRLNEAYKYNLLTPFHYFGVSDIYLDGESNFKVKNLSSLLIEDRIKHIVRKIKYYGADNDVIKGLIFVSNINEAKGYENSLNKHGLLTKALNSKSTYEERLKTVNALKSGEIEYIITVDIFNEGIDIPFINQIVLLRPTQSITVYTQQLGRGLRKYKDKEYVVVIDFIGNYKNNFLIPIALTGKNEYDKEKLKYSILPKINNFTYGSSVINFEKLAQKKIIDSLSVNNIANMQLIKEEFNYLSKRLNKVPTLYDFLINDSISPLVILDIKKTYVELKHTILKDKKTNELITNKNMMNYLEFISQKLVPAKRIEETILLEMILKYKHFTSDDIKSYFEENSYTYRSKVIENALKHLSKNIFQSLSSYKKYNKFLEIKEKNYLIADEFKKYCNNELFRNEVMDLISINKRIFELKYKGKGLLNLYEYYTKEEAFKYLLLEYNNGYQVSGYTVFENEKKLLIFIIANGETHFTRHNTSFISENKLRWYSTRRRTIFNKVGELTKEGKIANNDYEIEVFVKRNQNENFLYIGQVKEVISYKEIKDEKNLNMIEYTFRLKKKIEKEIYKSFKK